MTYAEKLRKFADYLDNHPVLSEQVDNKWEQPTLYIICNEWEKFQEVIRDLDGFTKSGYGGTLTARHAEEDEDGYHIFRVSVNISDVCESVPKVDEDGQPVMRKITKVVETGEIEPVMEWKCPEVWTQG